LIPFNTQCLPILAILIFIGELYLAFWLLPKCLNTSKRTLTDTSKTSPTVAYSGSASVTQGIATTLTEAIYSCERGRKTDVGKMSTDKKEWIVPA